jgi:hypothetical protein
MEFDAIWKQMLAKDPALLNPDQEIVFKAGNLKKLLRQVHRLGGKNQSRKDTSDSDFGNMFEQMFGKKG